MRLLVKWQIGMMVVAILFFEASPRCPGVAPPQDPSRLVAMLWIRSLGSTILGKKKGAAASSG